MSAGATENGQQAVPEKEGRNRKNATPTFFRRGTSETPTFLTCIQSRCPRRWASSIDYALGPPREFASSGLIGAKTGVYALLFWPGAKSKDKRLCLACVCNLATN
jgi:hypothetical protein